MLLTNGLIIFLINDKLTFINGPRSQQRNPYNYIILKKLTLNSFILVDELFAKVLQSFEICRSVLIIYEKNCLRHTSFIYSFFC